MMQEVEVLKTIQELICSFFSEEQFTLSPSGLHWTFHVSSRTIGVTQIQKRGLS